MADLVSVAEVRLWGGTVGAVAELDNGRILFEYSEEFPGRELEISPVHLPRTLKGPVGFDELARSPAFEGLPGVLADSLPDAFGNKVIRAYFAARGEEGKAMSPVQRLLYVGERAIGALTFHPAAEVPLRDSERESLEIRELVDQARRIAEGRTDVPVPEIYRIGSSAGGMRPKAIVLHRASTGGLRPGYLPPQDGETPCILKFDGAGEGSSSQDLGRPLPFNRIEAAYAAMAREAGIRVQEVALFEERGYAHLLIERFDLRDGERLHQHTLGGLLHVDYNLPGASSYEEFLRAVLRLGMGGAAIEEAYRRACFNVLAVNQDDHVKNLSFHMDGVGKWSLAPAYDLTFAEGRGFTARHQMSLAGKTAAIRRDDLLVLARTFRIRAPGRIVGEVEKAVGRFEEFANRFGVPPESLRAVSASLERRRAALSAR